MKRVFKIIGIVIAVIILILFIIVGFANGKRIITKTGYQDCPAYIFVVAEYTEPRPEISVIQAKIDSLNIGTVVLKELENNQILISVKGAGAGGEETRQKISKIEQELSLQEVRMEGGGAFRAKTCPTGETFQFRQ